MCLLSLWDWWLVLRMTDCKKTELEPSLCYRLCALILKSCWPGPSIKCHLYASSVLFAICCTVVCEAGVNCWVWFVVLLKSSCADVSEQVLNIWAVAASSFSCPQEMLGDQLWVCCSWLEGYVWFALFRWHNYGRKSVETNLCIYTLSRGAHAGCLVVFFLLYSLVCCMWVLFKTQD